MNSIKRSFYDKRFRYGSFSTVMVILAVCLFVVVNMVSDQLNISRDLTRDQIFTLSQGSINVVQDVDRDIRIYSLWTTGNENFLFQQLLFEYANHSNHITVSNRDPLLHPLFVESFAQPDEPIATGSIIVVGPDRHRVVHAADLVSTQFDMQTWQNRVVSFDVEPQVTNAIHYVMQETTPVIYRVVGNNEFRLPDALIQEMEMAGYEIREINLLMYDVPEDADLLFITLPETGRDWSPDQAERILNYLENDGRAIFVLGYRGTRFPNMDEVLAAFGIRVGDYIVIEGDTNNFFGNTPTMLLPDIISQEITEGMMEREFRPLIVQSTGIDTLEMRRSGTVIEPLLRTSSHAYGRTDPTITAITRTPDDVAGPFDIAVAVEDSFFMIGTNELMTTRIVAIGSEFILEEMLNAQLGGANWNFLMNSLSWLREEPARIFIRGQAPPATMPLMMSQAHAGMIALLSVVVLPLSFGIIGLIIWLRRRNA